MPPEVLAVTVSLPLSPLSGATVFFKLLAQFKIGMQNCKRSRDLIHQCYHMAFIGGFKRRDLWQFCVRFWLEQVILAGASDFGWSKQPDKHGTLHLARAKTAV